MSRSLPIITSIGAFASKGEHWVYPPFLHGTGTQLYANETNRLCGDPPNMWPKALHNKFLIAHISWGDLYTDIYIYVYIYIHMIPGHPSPRTPPPLTIPPVTPPPPPGHFPPRIFPRDIPPYYIIVWLLLALILAMYIIKFYIIF